MHLNPIQQLQTFFLLAPVARYRRSPYVATRLLSSFLTSVFCLSNMRLFAVGCVATSGLKWQLWGVYKPTLEKSLRCTHFFRCLALVTPVDPAWARRSKERVTGDTCDSSDVCSSLMYLASSDVRRCDCVYFRNRTAMWTSALFRWSVHRSLIRHLTELRIRCVRACASSDLLHDTCLTLEIAYTLWQLKERCQQT